MRPAFRRSWNDTFALLAFCAVADINATAAPTVTEVQNNYSFIAPGLPNYGIAPGSLFIVKGTSFKQSAIIQLAIERWGIAPYLQRPQRLGDGQWNDGDSRDLLHLSNSARLGSALEHAAWHRNHHGHQ